MKNFNYLLGLLFMPLMFSCTDIMDSNDAKPGHDIDFIGVWDNAVSTRTHWNEDQSGRLLFSWDSSSDEMKMLVSSGSDFKPFNNAVYSNVNVTPLSDNRLAAGLRTNDQLATNYVSGDIVHAYSPINDMVIDGNTCTFSMEIPAEVEQQYSGTTEHLKKYAFISGSGVINDETETVQIAFHTLPSIIRVKIKNLSESPLEVSGVTLLNNKFCNRMNVSLNADGTETVDNSLTESIGIKYSNIISPMLTDRLYTLIFPSDIKEGDNIGVKLLVKDGDTVKELNTEMSVSRKMFDANNVYTIGIDTDGNSIKAYNSTFDYDIDIEDAINIATDFTDNNKKDIELYNVWAVTNRISPETGPGVKEGNSVNLIRMLGGIKKNNKPYYEYDVVTYNSGTGKYEYDFTPLFSRLDKVVNSSTPIYQIVLDQPDWAFQQGYTFIPDNQRDYENFRNKEKLSVYGNSLPPCDSEAYSEYIQELMRQLINRYGKEKVLSWRFRIGSEIETPDHWFGTKWDFINHYVNMTNAIRAVLPDAMIGTHTCDYNYSKPSFIDYKGVKRASFTKDLLQACKNRSITYNFWGVTDYISLIKEESRNIPEKFENYYKPFLNDPNWNQSVKIDMMEYSPIVNMGLGVSGYINCVSSHATAMETCLTHMFYKHHDRLGYIFRWGNRPSATEPKHLELINSMNGKTSYTPEITGEPKVTGNYIDAITACGTDGYDVLVYNYNPKSLDFASDKENIVFSMVTDLPANTVIRYKEYSVSPKNNKLDCFRAEHNYDISSYIRTDNQAYAKMMGIGNPNDCFTESGLEEYNSFPTPESCDESDWVEITTVACPDNAGKSIIRFTTTLSSFSLKKIEFRK